MSFLIEFTEPVRALINTISTVVGGIFGVYLIIAFLRWREYRVIKTNLREIRDELKKLNRKMGTTVKKKK